MLTSATTLLYMRDGSFFQNPKEDVELTGTTFSYLLKEDEGNHAGIARIQLVVRFNEGLDDEQNFPSQLYDFEIVNGLETQVAQQIMIHDWTTLTREARAYSDEFAANEILRKLSLTIMNSTGMWHLRPGKRVEQMRLTQIKQLGRRRLAMRKSLGRTPMSPRNLLGIPILMKRRP